MPSRSTPDPVSKSSSLGLVELQDRLGVAEVHEHVQVAAPHLEQPGVLVDQADVVRERRVGQLGPFAPKRGEPAVHVQHPRVPAGADLTPVELRALERLRVLRIGHDGRVPPIRSNSAIRASAVAFPSSGSGWEVKNWNGVDAAHSSPWKSIGVNGPASGQQRGARELVVVERLGDPVADRAVADLVVVLAGDDEAPGRHLVGVDRMAVVAVAERGERPVVEEAALDHLRQRRQRLEVGVVAVGLAGQRHVHGVVEVVAPLRVQPVAAGLARGDELRVVEVALRDQGRVAGRWWAAARRPRSPAPRAGARRGVVEACTASSRSPSTW